MYFAKVLFGAIYNPKTANIHNNIVNMDIQNH